MKCMFLQFQLVDASKAVLSQETLYRLHCVQFSLREGEEGGGGSQLEHVYMHPQALKISWRRDLIMLSV